MFVKRSVYLYMSTIIIQTYSHAFGTSFVHVSVSEFFFSEYHLTYIIIELEPKLNLSSSMPYLTHFAVIKSYKFVFINEHLKMRRTEIGPYIRKKICCNNAI